MSTSKRLRDAAKDLRTTAADLLDEAKEIDRLAIGKVRALRLMNHSDQMYRVAADLEMLASEL
jgi:hypothetical protein